MPTTISIPITLPQMAEGLRTLSAQDLETLEILLDKDAMKIIDQSVAQAKRGKLKEL